MIQGSVQILYHYLDKLTYVRITLGNPSEKYQEIAQFLTKNGGWGGRANMAVAKHAINPTWVRGGFIIPNTNTNSSPPLTNS